MAYVSYKLFLINHTACICYLAVAVFLRAALSSEFDADMQSISPLKCMIDFQLFCCCCRCCWDCSWHILMRTEAGCCPAFAGRSKEGNILDLLHNLSPTFDANIPLWNSDLAPEMHNIFSTLLLHCYICAASAIEKRIETARWFFGLGPSLSLSLFLYLSFLLVSLIGLSASFLSRRRRTFRMDPSYPPPRPSSGERRNAKTVLSDWACLIRLSLSYPIRSIEQSYHSNTVSESH